MLIPAEEPGGMTWQEVKDFLDHIRVTCMDDRQMWKERARNAERELKRCQDALMRLELDKHEAIPEGWLECAGLPKDKYFIVEGDDEYHIYEEDDYGAFS